VNSGRLLFLGVDIGGTSRMMGEVAGEGAGRVLMFMLTSVAGLREFIKNRISKVTRGIIVSSRITITPRRVKRKRRCVRLPPPDADEDSKKNNSKDLRGV
jgi:hypothetical protein